MITEADKVGTFQPGDNTVNYSTEGHSDKEHTCTTINGLIHRMFICIHGHVHVATAGVVGCDNRQTPAVRHNSQWII